MKKISFKPIWSLLAVLTLASCGGKGTSSQGNYFIVSFDTGSGGTVIESQSIRNGGLVTRPNDPERPGYVFAGDWLNGDFPWEFDVDIVTSNLTLVAEWLELSSSPSNISVTDEPFSSILTWRQTEAQNQTFVVALKPVDGANYTVIEGDISVDTSDELNTVTFTPDVIPEGGAYYVKVSCGGEEVISDELILSGEGLPANPYIVDEISDIQAILSDTTHTYDDKNYLQYNDIASTITSPLEISNSLKSTFSGQYDGGNHSLSFTGNGGLFHEITATGAVKNLVIDSTTQLYASEANTYPIGAISDINNGLIDNVTSRALLEDNHLQGDLPVFEAVDTADHSTGAGGLVGINGSSGIIRNVTISGSGAVKAGRGIGGVAAYNMGLIEHATVTATLPAGNQANSAKSSNTYSYAGGIVGFNFGTIQYVSVSGRVFAQSAYAAAGDGNEGKNIGFGGIAGYNEGLISNAAFARSMSSKEFIAKSRATELSDAANNLGVASIHGDMYVGGIAGINAGEVSSSYVGGALIGGRDYVGGVSGLTTAGSNIHNTYVFAEVAIKDDGGLKVTSANTKTTATTYAIASNGYDTNTTFAKDLLNSESGSTWIPGDVASPALPSFTADDWSLVGSQFTENGTLLWQQGAVTGVNITLETLALPFGQQTTLEYSVLPSSAPDQLTVWTSSDDTIVEIVGEGIIKGIGVGSATITVTTRDGGFTDSILVTVEDYIHIAEVNVSSEITLPEPNNSADRPEIEIGTVLNFTVEILPEDADYQSYVLDSSNSRAVVNGNEVEFVLGSGAGNVSITISFEDSSFQDLEYRFKTVAASIPPVDTPISEVVVTSDEYQLPTVNNSEDRKEIEVGTMFTLTVNIAPENASNKNYSVVSSQTGRATVDGLTVSVIGVGNFSIKILFEDTSVGSSGLLEYRFLGINAPTPEGLEYAVSSPSLEGLGYALPLANGGAETKVTLEGTPTFSILVTITSGEVTTFNADSSNTRAIVTYELIDSVYVVTVDPVESNIGAFTITINIDGTEYNYRFGSTAIG
ncbi:MAG TPA: Ig-like domain-containing protein [Bacilli bacterium]|nr:Ig-like domain-containing protein [Bacilli bacterium]